MAITYNAVTNIITVTGYTEAVPCTFNDIYNADVAGGWGVWGRQCNNQYCSNAGLEIGDGSTVTWFKDTSKMVRFTVYTAGYRDAMTVRALGNAQIGEIMDASNKLGKNGCELYFAGVLPNWGIAAEYSGNLKIYGSFLTGEIYYGSGSSNRGQTGNLTVWTSRIDHSLYVHTTDNDIFGNTINQNQRANSYGATAVDGVTIDNVDIFGTRDRGGLSFLRPGTMTAKNCFFRDNDYIIIVWGGFLGATPCYIINADTDTWNIKRWANGEEIIYRQYELDLKVQDKDENALNGAAVKVWDLNDNLVVDVTTGTNGKITTQTLTYGYYTYAGGNTPVMQTPHTIQISKAGYETYQKKFTLDKKTDWIIALHKPKHTSNRVFKVRGIPKVTQA